MSTGSPPRAWAKSVDRMQSAISSGASAVHGRGRGRGRGRSRGRGRGRGQGSDTAIVSPESTLQVQRPIAVQDNFRTDTKTMRPKAPLTHFIALPIGHHARLREMMSTFATGLLDGSPPILGLDRSVIISPRRFHLTLGVMSLQSHPTSHSAETLSTSGQEASTSGLSSPKTVAAALALLSGLRPRIKDIIGDEKLRVELKSMDIMKPDRGDPEKANVMWVGPTNNGAGSRLKEVCGLVQKAFIDAGLLVDERRELKLHCTVINTTYRKPRTRGRRIPFSYPAILASAAFRAVDQNPPSLIGNPDSKYKGPVSVDFGTWDVDEIQLCEMGSWGPEGEYVSAGSISLS